MATTLGSVINTIRGFNLVDISKVNAYTTQNLQPPYIQVGSFVRVWDRDTTAGLLVSTFSVLVVAKDLDSAESLAASVDARLDKNYSTTPQTVEGGMLQERYEVGAVDPANLYQMGVRMDYVLTEDPTIPLPSSSSSA